MSDDPQTPEEAEEWLVRALAEAERRGLVQPAEPLDKLRGSGVESCS